MKHPCDKCIALVMCINRTLDYKLSHCHMIRSELIIKSNILDPVGLSNQGIKIEDTEVNIRINYLTDFTQTPTHRSREIIASYPEDSFHHSYNNDVLLGEFDKLYEEVKAYKESQQ